MSAGTRTRAESDADFADLFARHRVGALRLAFVLCGDAATAEDAVAEAFARMYPQWRKGGIDDPAAYLRRAVVNQVYGGFRRLAVRRRYAAQQRPEPPVAAGDDAVVERDRLRAALLALPARQRAVIALRFLDDLSEADTAAALGVSVGTVKTQVSRGLERLRALLADPGTDSDVSRVDSPGGDQR